MKSKTWSIRSIGKNDLNELLELYKHLHRNDLLLHDQEKLVSIWKQICSNQILSYFVLERNNKFVSSCSLTVIPNITRGGRPYGIIENVVSHTDYRRRGYGTAIVKYALEIAWKKNCYKVMLLTGSKDPGIHRFYEKAGFGKGGKTGFVAYSSDFLL